MMTGTGYRKAMEGEVRCSECVHSFVPTFTKRIRCGDKHGTAYAVGINMTCKCATAAIKEGETNE